MVEMLKHAMMVYAMVCYAGMVVYLAVRGWLVRELSKHYDKHGFMFLILLVTSPITLPIILFLDIIES